MQRKTCFKCGKRRSLSMFYKHSKMAGGHLNKCKDCTKSDVKRNYRKNIEHYKEYERNRAMLPHRVEARSAYQQTENGKAAMLRATQKYRRDYPEKYRAHTAVSNAVRSGKMKRQPCEVCGDKAHAHHDDYSKPLDVRWLCAIHHNDLHKGRL